MSHTVSPQQLAANRVNAVRSTGPRTLEGKLHSSQNARKHGFTATKFAVVRLEDLQEVAHLREDLVAVYQPVNSQELFALERVALAQQSILRAARFEAGFFSACLNESCESNGECTLPMNSQITADIDVTKSQNRNFVLVDGFNRFASQSNSFALLLRYQAQAERQYRRAIEEFERLKALRDELPNEPISASEPESQPEPIENTCTRCEASPFPPGHSAPAPAPDAPAPGPGSPAPAPGPWPPAPAPQPSALFGDNGS
jgi:hypothetical protein